MLRCPPRPTEPRERTLTDGTKVKWCIECSYWGEHFYAGHNAGNAVGAEGAQCGNNPEDVDVAQEATRPKNSESAAGLTVSAEPESPDGP